jgi:hypothetical protein
MLYQRGFVRKGRCGVGLPFLSRRRDSAAFSTRLKKFKDAKTIRKVDGQFFARCAVYEASGRNIYAASVVTSMPTLHLFIESSGQRARNRKNAE